VADRRFLAGRPSRIAVAGPLEPFTLGFRAWLTDRGFTRHVVTQHTHLLAHMSGWMLEHQVAVEELGSDELDRFLQARRSQGCRVLTSPRGLASLAAYLREAGGAPGPSPLTPAGPAEELLARYRDYLLTERGLAPLSVTAYTHTARLLLGWLAEVPQVAAPDGLARMSPPLVAQFLLARAGQVQAWAMKATAGRLRAFLRYLYAAGLIPHPLDGAVPPPAGWGLTALAKAVPEEKIAAVLAACDRATARGRRDYAIVLILRRLGLRNGEVARLDLDDIDWRAGVMLVHLKGGRITRVPLPPDVGQVMADYLTDGRPETACRRVFVIHRAPFSGLSRSAVTDVVRGACRRAGIDPAFAPHRLRHSLASELLRQGASMHEVGQVLAHRFESTTAVYAKLDYHALGELARPWPAARAQTAAAPETAPGKTP
jgi:site-specific recombinase XerD